MKLAFASSLALAAAIAAGVVLSEHRREQVASEAATAASTPVVHAGRRNTARNRSASGLLFERPSLVQRDVAAASVRKPSARPTTVEQPAAELLEQHEGLQDELWTLEDDMRRIATNPQAWSADEYEDALERVEDRVGEVEFLLALVEQELAEQDA